MRRRDNQIRKVLAEADRQLRQYRGKIRTIRDFERFMHTAARSGAPIDMTPAQPYFEALYRSWLSILRDGLKIRPPTKKIDPSDLIFLFADPYSYARGKEQGYEPNAYYLGTERYRTYEMVREFHNSVVRTTKFFEKRLLVLTTLDTSSFDRLFNSAPVATNFMSIWEQLLREQDSGGYRDAPKDPDSRRLSETIGVVAELMRIHSLLIGIVDAIWAQAVRLGFL